MRGPVCILARGGAHVSRARNLSSHFGRRNVISLVGHRRRGSEIEFATSMRKGRRNGRSRLLRWAFSPAPRPGQFNFSLDRSLQTRGGGGQPMERRPQPPRVVTSANSSTCYPMLNQLFALVLNQTSRVMPLSLAPPPPFSGSLLGLLLLFREPEIVTSHFERAEGVDRKTGQPVGGKRHKRDSTNGALVGE